LANWIYSPKAIPSGRFYFYISKNAIQATRYLVDGCPYNALFHLCYFIGKICKRQAILLHTWSHLDETPFSLFTNSLLHHQKYWHDTLFSI
jgi:hypothetical protein